MRFVRRLLIFSYGLFTIAAQTLLFREFITTFEGNDISVGIFFGSWFLWVGLGALLVYRAKSFAEKLLEQIEFLFLGYLPAFIVQLILIIQARELAGVESYALLSIRTILLLSILINAPVSVITGMLFPIACRWVQQDEKLAVSHVYIIEAAGSFCGGLGVTVLLGFGISLARAFFILAFTVSLSAFFVQLAKRLIQSRRAQEQESTKIFGRVPVLQLISKWSSPCAFISCALTFLIPLFSLFCLAVGADKTLMRYVRTIKWTKLLPKDALIDSFQTAQAEYLYGMYRGQWVAIRQGSVCEALPDESSAGQVAAINLCQNPDARRVLVIGSGLWLCYEFLRLPQMESVTWTHCDSEYVQKVERFIPSELKISDKRFYRLAGDVRSLLAEKKRYYDIVILNLPDATSSVLNRYYTLEFYEQVKESLRSNGVFGIRIAGGENIMGTELVNLGASTKLTLEKVFPKLVITPGEDTWFIVTDSQNLTGDPGVLRDRFAKIEGANRVFSAQALLSVYLPDRAAAALESYSGADLPESLLINRDSRPLTNLYSLLLAAKQSGAPIAKFAKQLALAGPLVFFIPLLVFIVLRAIFISKAAWEGGESSFDSTFLVFSTGWVGIGIVIVLMYLYQTRFGSLYLHIGVISSLFMVGLTAGAALIRHLLVSSKKTESPRVRPAILLFAVMFVHTLILITIAFWAGEELTEAPNGVKGVWESTHFIFAIAFVLCGMCVGSYFPLAARQMADSGFETGQAGSKLETADHLGASAGGLLTGLALVPVLGTKAALFVFVLLILANVPPAVLRMYKREKVRSLATVSSWLRRLGYILFGIGVSVVLCSNLLVVTGIRLRALLPQYAAQALASQMNLEQVSTIVPDGARKVNYFKVYDVEEKLSGYIFSSEELAPEICGFGGGMNLIIYVDTAGRLINFHIIRSNETPAYLERLTQWRNLLKGHQLFQLQPLADVHAVTGATISSKAVLSALSLSGRRFATEVLGQSLQPEHKEQVHPADYLPGTEGVYLVSAVVLALIVIYRGGFWSRLAVLLFNLVVGGIILNAQYSSEQIATLLSMQTASLGLSGAVLLVTGIPLLAIIFGNIYCGYICPFGAAQELLGYVVPERFKEPIPVEKMRAARFVKYVVLFVLIILFFISRNRTTLAADPLIEVFNLRFQVYDSQSTIVGWKSSMLLIVAIALIGSVFYARFWCRYLCPAGAFLSLFNKVALLKRYLPAKRFGKCEFGLTVKDQLDCLYCDRCRYETKAALKEEQPVCSRHTSTKLLSRYFVVIVLIVATFISAVSVSRFLQVVPAGALGQPVVSVYSGGQPRDVDLQRVRTMIQQEKLSDREAEFYKKAE
jgi:predicted membrane-bound spermidine synthase/Na+-translocating ferredoxin:NAD+ oxidoreductase RnfG subunit